jgi:hypothetical protein
MALAMKSRSVWEDRFSRPTLDALLAEVAKPAGGFVEAFIEGMKGLEGVSGELGWHGVPWRWSLVYRDGSGRVLGYLVPSPIKAGVSVPVPEGLISGGSGGGLGGGSGGGRKVSKVVREVVAGSPVVGGVQWAWFELSSRTVADDVVGLIGMVRAAGGAGVGAGA